MGRGDSRRRTKVGIVVPESAGVHIGELLEQLAEARAYLPDLRHQSYCEAEERRDGYCQCGRDDLESDLALFNQSSVHTASDRELAEIRSRLERISAHIRREWIQPHDLNCPQFHVDDLWNAQRCPCAVVQIAARLASMSALAVELTPAQPTNR